MRSEKQGLWCGEHGEQAVKSDEQAVKSDEQAAWSGEQGVRVMNRVCGVVSRKGMVSRG